MSERKLTLTLAELNRLIDKCVAEGKDYVDIVAYVEEREKKKEGARYERKGFTAGAERDRAARH